MDLLKYREQLKSDKGKDSLIHLIISILKIEEIFIEKSNDTAEIIKYMKSLIDCALIFSKEIKIEITSDTVQDLDLNYWKDNIHLFKPKNETMSSDVFFYSIRSSLLFLLNAKKDKTKQRVGLFEILIKTFLLVDFYNLSIDSILSLESED